MVTILNRRELILTLSMERQAAIRAILSANDIDYKIKTTNLQNSSQRTSRGSLRTDSDRSYEYKIYVHKKDYEYAKHLISKST